MDRAVAETKARNIAFTPEVIESAIDDAIAIVRAE
jgi:hypothetical protein